MPPGARGRVHNVHESDRRRIHCLVRGEVCAFGAATWNVVNTGPGWHALHDHPPGTPKSEYFKSEKGLTSLWFTTISSAIPVNTATCDRAGVRLTHRTADVTSDSLFAPGEDGHADQRQDCQADPDERFLTFALTEKAQSWSCDDIDAAGDQPDPCDPAGIAESPLNRPCFKAIARQAVPHANPQRERYGSARALGIVAWYQGVCRNVGTAL